MKKLLYVDDEDINLLLFRITFSKLFEVVTAESGRIALEYLESHKNVSLVISDWNMPIMNGLELIKKIKELNPTMPCVMISGYGKNSEIEQAINDKIIIDYVTKPFEKDFLHTLINNTLDSN